MVRGSNLGFEPACGGSFGCQSSRKTFKSLWHTVGQRFGERYSLWQTSGTPVTGFCFLRLKQVTPLIFWRRMMFECLHLTPCVRRWLRISAAARQYATATRLVDTSFTRQYND